MRAFYDANGQLMGYVESEHEAGFSVEGMTARSVTADEIGKFKQELKDKKSLKGPKDIDPPKETKPVVTPHPKV